MALGAPKDGALHRETFQCEGTNAMGKEGVHGHVAA